MGTKRYAVLVTEKDEMRGTKTVGFAKIIVFYSVLAILCTGIGFLAGINFIKGR